MIRLSLRLLVIEGDLLMCSCSGEVSDSSEIDSVLDELNDFLYEVDYLLYSKSSK